MVVCYIATILCSRRHPVAGFLIPLTTEQDAAAQTIEDSFDQGLHLHHFIHKFSFTLLSMYRLETIDNEWQCPLHRFLVLYHLKEDGTFPPINLIPTNISKLQWFFRSVACYKACQWRNDHPDSVIGSDSRSSLIIN